MARRILPFLPYIVVSAVHCVLIIGQLPGSGYETKQLLMPALALAVLWSLWRVRPVRWSATLLVGGAIVASWLGDGAGLFFPALPTLPVMIVWFALAHICYMVLFAKAPGIASVRRVPVWTLVYAVWWGVMLAIVGPHAGSLFIAVAVYGLVLGGTAALSPRLGPTAAWGGLFFLFSDTSLAMREFVGMPEVWSNILVMPTYTLGQGLIVFAAVSALRDSALNRKSESGEPRASGEVADR